DRPLPLPVLRSAGVRPGVANDGMDSLWIQLPASSAFDVVLRDSRYVTPGSALWWTQGGADFAPALAITAGLIAPAAFAALLDGAPLGQGWRVADSVASANGELDWDRDG